MKPATQSPTAPRLACPTKLPKARVMFAHKPWFGHANVTLIAELYRQHPAKDMHVAVIPLRQRPTRARLAAVQRILGMSDRELGDLTVAAMRNGGLFYRVQNAASVLDALGLLPARKGRAGK